MNIQWNVVTWYSKLGAIILFLLVVPVLTFVIGERYQEVKDMQSNAIVIPTIVSQTHQDPIAVTVNLQQSQVATSSTTFSITTPVVSVPSDPSVEKKINNSIQEKINQIMAEQIDIFGASTTFNVAAFYSTSPKYNTLSIDFHDLASNEKITQPTFDSEEPLIFDLVTGSEVKIYDVLGLSESDFLLRISTLTKKKLKSSYVGGTFFDEEQFQKGTDPKPENYQFIVMMDDQLKIFMAYDQIGMKPIEEPAILITYKELGL